MSVERLARREDPVTHHREVLAIGGAILAGLGIGALFFFTGGTGVLAIVVAGGNAAGTGLILGDWFRGSAGRSVWGHIGVGARSVHVGARVRDAAFASTISTVDCHESYVAQGSSTVFIEGWNAARRGDGTECGGLIGDGCDSVFVGGEPTLAPGARVGPERHGNLYWALYIASSIAIPGLNLVRRHLPAAIKGLLGRDILPALQALAGSAEILLAVATVAGSPHRLAGAVASASAHEVRLGRGPGSTAPRAWGTENRSRFVGILVRLGNAFR